MNTGITDVCTRCLCSAGAQAPGFMHTGRISSSCPHLTTAPFLLVHTQNLESLLPAPILPHSTSMSPHPQIPLAELQNPAQCIFHRVWQCPPHPSFCFFPGSLSPPHHNPSGSAKRQDGLYPLLSSNASLIPRKPASTQRPARPSQSFLPQPTPL